MVSLPPSFSSQTLGGRSGRKAETKASSCSSSSFSPLWQLAESPQLSFLARKSTNFRFRASEFFLPSFLFPSPFLLSRLFLLMCVHGLLNFSLLFPYKPPTPTTFFGKEKGKKLGQLFFASPSPRSETEEGRKRKKL